MRLGAHTSAPRLRALPAAVDLRVVGSQAFQGTSALGVQGASVFNAAIGAWNTASVNDLAYVCAAFGPGARHHGGRAGRLQGRMLYISKSISLRTCVCARACARLML
jgi:hypothetical protein